MTDTDNDTDSSAQAFATCARGLESILVDELKRIGIDQVSESAGGVRFAASTENTYRAVIHSRVASRILLGIGECGAHDADTLYEGLRDIDWCEILLPGASIAVDFNGRSPGIRNSHFGALRVKDAIVDTIRDSGQDRPDVDLETPDLRINVHLSRDVATIALDIGGDALHRRGYRLETNAAPLKENLAAALLLRANWATLAADGAALHDPMCGSGTLVIEAALIAANIAPGLELAGPRRRGFDGWAGHVPALWNRLIDEAEQAIDYPSLGRCRLTGADNDGRALAMAEANARRAGLGRDLEFQQRPLSRLKRADIGDGPGLLITNPPYGERLSDEAQVVRTYRELGDVLKNECVGWNAAVLVPRLDLGKQMGLRAERKSRVYNGPLECHLLQFSIDSVVFVDRERANARDAERRLEHARETCSPFINRLKKNARHRERWARRQGLTCYRLYDADIPEFAVAIDRYDGWLHVAEYAAPRVITSEQAAERLAQILAVLPEALAISADRIAVKRRERQSGTRQYNKMDQRGEFQVVSDGAAGGTQVQARINLHDYLDTGLFLDHRRARQWIGANAAGKRFLNLFCYTAVATLHAALGGAASSTSVDMSSTYLDWAHSNFTHNKVDLKQHALQQADVLTWLQRERGQWDLIFLDPPTFSNSKRMEDRFDVQADHSQLIGLAMARLAAGGVLLFSTNRRRFVLDEELQRHFIVEVFTRHSIDDDFRHQPPIHQSWLIRSRD
ncbi:bifunctional 23S rRNA (guanine(2069)-N(7))-methyltransferase RlmK/23S rRNA (guanine(2445)-N(2))-methyltransferase RlmL [Gammaproteobacteria bacterium]|nr:bifunctional 23S rRNA (guanine(2069)-N(7))-methyltransferase RlmK/23S rRNA (guanine(2445)-N(2))-methyltransferase RlmL [Gammaproteobacteria bacterium]